MAFALAPKSHAVIVGSDGHHSTAKHGQIRHMMNVGRYPHRLKYFHVTVPNNNPEQSDKTLFAMSATGAYTVVRTHVRASRSDDPFATEPAYALIHSQYPVDLYNYLKRSARDELDADTIKNSNIQVLKAYREKDLEGPDNGKGLLDFDWAYEGIRDHDNFSAEAIEDHGHLAQENDRYFQSRSSLFWLEDAGDDKYHVRYYCNQKHVRKNIIDAEVLKRKAARGWLRFFSIPLTSEPLPHDEAIGLIRNKFGKFSRNLLEGVHPYTTQEQMNAMELNPWSLDRVRHKTKTASLNFFLGAGVTVSQIDKVSLLLTVGITTAMILGGYSAAFVGGVAKEGKMGIISKGAKGLFNLYRKFDLMLKGWSLNRDGQNVAELLASGPAVNFGYDMKSYPVKEQIVQGATPADLLAMQHAIPVTRELRAKDFEDWGKHIILDPKASAAGTLFTIQDHYGEPWLHSTEPKGLDILYKTNLRIALATKARTPDRNCHVEIPIEQLFADAKGNEIVLYDTDNGIETARHDELAEITASRQKALDETKAKIRQEEYESGHSYISSLSHDEMSVMLHQRWRAYKKSHKEEFRKARWPALVLSFAVKAARLEGGPDDAPYHYETPYSGHAPK